MDKYSLFVEELWPPRSVARTTLLWMLQHWFAFALYNCQALGLIFHPSLQALASADVLLIAAGAGFSADSGLPVYDSIAADTSYSSIGVTYSDLCSPLMMVECPECVARRMAICKVPINPSGCSTASGVCAAACIAMLLCTRVTHS